MVLDMFGNVFGRSKKNSSSSNVTASQNEHLIRPTQPPQPAPASGTDDKAPVESGWTELNWTSPPASAQPPQPVPYPPLPAANVRPTPTTPIDNVPFSHSAQLSAVRLNRGTQMTDLGRCLNTIDRIGVQLQSERFAYDFKIENTVMREVQATSNGFGF